MSDKFEEGDRVILIGESIIPTRQWPVWESKHGCVGTIVAIDGGLAWVDWDNGITKMILPINLSHSNPGEQNALSPNRAFLKYKRKLNDKYKKRR